MTVKVTKPAINVREELADLRKPTGIAGEAMLRAETPQEQFNLIGAGRRNWLINGDFQVSQRGDYSSATSAATGSYYLDRWTVSHGVAATIQQAADVPTGTPFSYSAKYVATASGTTDLNLLQKIEDVSVLKGQTVIISAWVKSNSPNCRILVFQGSSGGWNSATTAHSGGGEWEYLTLPVQISTSANEVRVYFCFRTELAAAVSIASGDFIQITGVQLEVGKVATPFEHRSYGEELALCQRYYYRQTQTAVDENIGIASAFDADDAYAIIRFPVTMRAAPEFGSSAASTMKLVGDNTSYTAATVNAFNLTPHTCSFQLRNSGITQGNSYLARFSSTVSSSNFIEFDAEL